jgi:hypothetical protein
VEEVEAEVAVEAIAVQLFSAHFLDMSLSWHSFLWTRRVNPIYTHTLHTPFLEVCLSEQPITNIKKSYSNFFDHQY